MIESTDLTAYDQIQVEDLVVRTIIGIYARERDRCQEGKINLTFWTDIRPAARSDDIEQAVDYRTLTKNIIEHVKESRCMLLERLTEELAVLVLEDLELERARDPEERQHAVAEVLVYGAAVLAGDRIHQSQAS